MTKYVTRVEWSQYDRMWHWSVTTPDVRQDFDSLWSVGLGRSSFRWLALRRARTALINDLMGAKEATEKKKRDIYEEVEL